MWSWARFNFYIFLRPYIHCLYFICKRKFYARAHVKSMRQRKSRHKARRSVIRSFLGCGDFKGLTTRFRESLLFSSSLDEEDKRRPCSRGVSDVKNGVLIFLARMFFRNDTFYVKTRLFLCGEIWVQSNLHVRPSTTTIYPTVQSTKSFPVITLYLKPLVRDCTHFFLFLIFSLFLL